jgi:saccharopine dehydrogenase (NAD+, L-lysine-forming)
MANKPTLWLRAEHKPREERSIVTPAAAGELVAAGFPVVIEASAQRAQPLQDYIDVGCKTAVAGAWRTAPADVIVAGLKELDARLGPFRHRHIHFAHLYKYQQGWQATLRQFDAGHGALYDLEYLVDEAGCRVAAFGHWAGYIGAALAILAWASQQNTTSPATDGSLADKPLAKLQAWRSRQSLLQDVNAAMLGSRKPRAMIIGASGRSGRGAVEMCQACGIEVTAWGRAETAAGGPFNEILAHDILINCVFVGHPVKPFTTPEHLNNSQRQLAVISDVSCDPYGDANPLPVYSQCTTQNNPAQRLIEPTNHCSVPLDLVSIDHLPSLLPMESSADFSAQLTPHLLTLDHLDKGVWQRARELFDARSQEALTGITGLPGMTG